MQGQEGRQSGAKCMAQQPLEAFSRRWETRWRWRWPPPPLEREGRGDEMDEDVDSAEVHPMA